jgi:hypothetical protein
MRADNTAHLLASARQRAGDARARAEEVLAAMEATGEPGSISGLARAAGVSRSWLYSQPDLLDLFEQHRAGHKDARRAQGLRASDESLRRRLELAHQRIRDLSEQNDRLREQLARAHGALRAARTGRTPSDEDVPGSAGLGR